jgi:alkaline phosphatase
MTRSALAHLGEDHGFMLMIESASIDKEAHDWRPCGSIGEVGQLDEALQVALDYAVIHPETLILVTADHGHGAHITPQIADLALQGFATPGRFARVLTPEGGVMGINYATTDSPHWEEHSGVQVPVYASGPGVTDLPNYLHQGDIFHIAAKHLGLGDSLTAN